MNVDTLATVLTGIAVLLGVWRLAENARRDSQRDTRELGTGLTDLVDRVSRLETALTERIAHLEGTLTAFTETMRRSEIAQQYRSDVVQTRERQDD